MADSKELKVTTSVHAGTVAVQHFDPTDISWRDYVATEVLAGFFVAVALVARDELQEDFDNRVKGHA